MARIDRLARRVLPSTVVLSRHTAVQPVLLAADFVARLFLRPFGPRAIPPLRLIVRTGVGNRVLFPHLYYLTASYPQWLFLLSEGYATTGSTIVDVGCGCGKSAVALRDFDFQGERFSGRYIGVDVDAEQIRWCRAHFPADHFMFHTIDVPSDLYAKGHGRKGDGSLPASDASVDLVFGQSLFSHLMPELVSHYLAETARILRPGGNALFTFFSIDDLRDQGRLGDRWTFRHRRGPAFVESLRHPEAAIAYENGWMLERAKAAGFSQGEIILRESHQSTLRCMR